MSSETNNDAFRANVLAEIKSIIAELQELKNFKTKVVRKPARRTTKKKTAKRKPARKTTKRKAAKRKPARRTTKRRTSRRR